jgi:Fusaric acid resistance protein family
MRTSAFFESAVARLLDKRCRNVTYAALDLCVVAKVAAARFGVAARPASTSLWSFPALISETNNSSRENGIAVAMLVAAADRRALPDAHARLHEAKATLDSSSSMTVPRTALGLWSDPVAAAMTGVRSALAIAITSVFWIETAWPSGATAVIIAAVDACTFEMHPCQIILGVGITESRCGELEHLDGTLGIGRHLAVGDPVQIVNSKRDKGARHDREVASVWVVLVVIRGDLREIVISLDVVARHAVAIGINFSELPLRQRFASHGGIFQGVNRGDGIARTNTFETGL